MREIKVRIARPTNQLETISEMYRKGLGLEVLGSFQDHEGFDGIMIGVPGAAYHFEFTQQKEVAAPRAASSELLWVFYIPDSKTWCEITDQMLSAGFIVVSSHNPYWDLHGKTFEDPEGYRVVITRQEWVR